MTTDTTMNAANRPISVIGLGSMGRALAAALLDGGYRVTVWNRTAARADPLIAQGAVPAADPAQAVAAGGPVLVCLLDNAAVTATLDAARAELPGRTVVNLTNGTPAQARDLAERLRRQGAEYLDGGIMAIPSMIGTPEAFVLYSGERRTLEAHRAPLERLAAVHYAGPDPGMAALQDVALLSAMYGLFGGMAHAFALTGRAGLPAREFAGTLTEWLSAMAAQAPAFAEQLDAGDHRTDVGSTLDMQLAAYRNLVATAEETGVSPELIVPFQRLMARAAANGAGDADVMSVVGELSTGPAPAGPAPAEPAPA